MVDDSNSHQSVPAGSSNQPNQSESFNPTTEEHTPNETLPNENMEPQKGRLKSVVWQHFTKTKVNGEDKAQCNYCKKLLGGKSKNGTNHLRVHMDICIQRKITKKGQSVLLPKLVKGKQELHNGTYDPENAKKELASAIIMHEYPLSMVDHLGFRRYSAALQPLFHVPSRNTIKKEILKVYDIERSITSKLLDSNEGRVAITSDMWTSSNQKRGYMAITAHYIDSSWTLQSRILRICEIKLSISLWITSPIEVIQKMAKKMLNKFESYWRVIHDVMGVATVLDPRYKMELLEFYYEKVYGDNSFAQVGRIRQLCYDLVSDYQFKMSKESSSSSPLLDGGNIIGGDTLSDYDLYIVRKKRARTSYVKTELDHYLEEEVLPRTSDFDILLWWELNGVKYPMLQTVAKDVLAIPVSTVASESAFSTSGQILSPHRSRLHWTTLEALMCSRSWLWAVENTGNECPNSKTIQDYSTLLDEMESDDEDELMNTSATYQLEDQ